jgi:dTDP-4-dehydrorhamnose reductase
MKLLLFGARGRVGWELQRALAPLGEVIALDRHDARHAADFARPHEVASTVREMRPDVIVNAAAFTDMDRAQAQPQEAHLVNADGPAAIAEEAARLGAWLVHFSTDCVFDGTGDAPRDENAPPAPLSVYGSTKLEGERAVVASGCRHLVWRTGWVFARRGANFARTILTHAREHDRLRVVDDQVGAPTGAELLADLTAHALRAALATPSLGGIYHVAATGATSRFEYARFVLAQARAHGCQLRAGPDDVEAVPTSAYPLPAARPLNARLDTTRFRAAFGLELPRWRIGVARLVEEMVACEPFHAGSGSGGCDGATNGGRGTEGRDVADRVPGARGDGGQDRIAGASGDRGGAA